MKQTGFVKGDTNEAKFASIERALQRISRKTVKKVGVEVPPIPISKFNKTPDADGVLMRYMFPVSGYVEKAVIWAEIFPEDNKRVPLTLDIASFRGREERNLEITPTLNTFNVQMEVAAGSRFELKLADPTIEVYNIWTSFLYQISIKHNQLQELLVDKINLIAEDFSK